MERILLLLFYNEALCIISLSLIFKSFPAKSSASPEASQVAKRASQVNIRSFAFAPGMIDTNMQAIIRKSNTPNKNMFEKKNLTNTKPAARLATWLASGEADDLAGKDLNIRDNEIIQRASL